jgi:ATP-binding cassette subfamily B protein
LRWLAAGALKIGVLPLFIAPTRRRAEEALTLGPGAHDRTDGLVAETLSLSGALLVKNFDAAAGEVRRFRHKAEELKRLSLEQSLAGRWFRFLLGLFEVTGPAMVFALGGWLVIRGQTPLGTIVALVTLVKRLHAPASAVSRRTGVRSPRARSSRSRSSP